MMTKSPLEAPRREKLSDEEVAEAARLAVIAELDAISFYLQLARKIEDEGIRRVFEEVAREEMTHVGEFLAVLFKLDEKQAEELKEGFEEVKELAGFDAWERLKG